MKRTVMAIATAAVVAAAAPAAAAPGPQVAPAAKTGSAWASGAYTPRRGDWRPYVLSPSSRSIAPARVLDAQARQGTITGDPAASLRADGRAVKLTSTGARTGSPLLMLDFGQEVAGKVRVKVNGTSDPRPELHACFSESQRYMALGARNDGEAAHAPGCDTANIWIGFPGVAYTEDRDSHTLTFDGDTATDGQRRGGFRYLTLFLDGAGSVDVDGVSLDFTPAAGQGADLSRYAGRFLSSDDALNKAWYAGAYTVQLNTDSSQTAKSWPYEAGERDHADDAVPHADPSTDVIYDGGKRDRIVWQGDLAVQQPVTLLSTDDKAAVDNSLSSLAAQQEPDGYMPAESLVGQHNFDEKRTYGEYVTWFVHNMAEHWRFTGDRTYLERWWPALQRATAWLEGERQKDAAGLIGFASSGACGHYGYGDCGHETYVNALYKRNLDEMATMARALGQDGDAYAARAGAVAKAIDAELWDEDAGAYRLSRELPGAHPQDANAAAILTGVAGKARAARALAFLREHTWARYGSLTIDPAEGNPSLSPFYAPLPSGFEVQARLAGTDDPRGLEAARGMELIRRFWGYQLAHDPQSTLWEHVRTDGSANLGAFSSLAHGWAAGPTESLTTEVLGVDPSAAGFSRFDVAPQPGDLEWAEGRVPTPHGAVDASWTRDGDSSFSMDLTVPGGTTARALVPTFGRETRVTLDGRTMWDGGPKAAGVSRDGDRIVIEGIGAGAHKIASRATDRAPASAVELSASPSQADAAPGDTVAFTLSISGTAAKRFSGTVKTDAPDGWSVSPAAPRFDEPSGGRPASAEVKVFAVVPDDAGSGSYPLRFTATTDDGASATATGTVRLSSTRRLYSFDDDTEGWRPATNVSSVARVTGFANGPGRPAQGTGALEASVPSSPASSLKSVQVTPATPLNLGGASELHASLDCYGGAPGASGYEAVITAASGADVKTRTVPISCDSWNTLSLDLAGWSGRGSVDRIEVGFRALGSDTPWQPRFQVDDVGVTE